MVPTYKTVDTCAAEFEADTPYHYSTWEDETEVRPSENPRVLILGSGPNRIGQGIEFDYCCCQAAFALSGMGFETIMLNCNPETVSTDYDTADRLYFEPLTFEDVMEVFHAESESGTVAGVLVQLGGQTPLGLAAQLEDAGVPIVGTSPSAIHLAEDRREFGEVLVKAGLPAPAFGTAINAEEATEIAARIGYPVLVRPSYVLGGRGMEIVYDESSLRSYIERAELRGATARQGRGRGANDGRGSAQRRHGEGRRSHAAAGVRRRARRAPGADRDAGEARVPGAPHGKPHDTLTRPRANPSVSRAPPPEPQQLASRDSQLLRCRRDAVSYTHLTLPTSDLV